MTWRDAIKPPQRACTTARWRFPGAAPAGRTAPEPGPSATRIMDKSGPLGHVPVKTVLREHVVLPARLSSPDGYLPPLGTFSESPIAILAAAQPSRPSTMSSARSRRAMPTWRGAGREPPPKGAVGHTLDMLDGQWSAARWSCASPEPEGTRSRFIDKRSCPVVPTQRSATDGGAHNARTSEHWPPGSPAPRPRNRRRAGDMALRPAACLREHRGRANNTTRFLVLAATTPASGADKTSLVFPRPNPGAVHNRSLCWPPMASAWISHRVPASAGAPWGRLLHGHRGHRRRGGHGRPQKPSTGRRRLPPDPRLYHRY